MADFTMPSLGADMEVGELVEWMVKPGDSVKRGDIIAIAGTEKGEIEIEVFEDGVVEQLLIEEGTEVPVGTILALIRAVGEAIPAGALSPVDDPALAPITAPLLAPISAEEGHHPMDHRAVVRAESQPHSPTPTTNGHRIRVSPIARKIAQELGVDLATVTGSGPHGAINKTDVEKAVALAKQARQGAPPPAQLVKIEVASTKKPEQKPEQKPDKKTKKKAADKFQQGMRKAIARAMSRANQDIPHYYVETSIDMSSALAWLEAENQKRSIKDRVLPAVLMIKAVAKALTEVPQLNGFWLDERLQTQEGIHIGFAIALRQGGLVTPAIHHADLKDMDELMADMRDLIMRTRAGRLRSSELTDATITLTNLGDMGVETVYGVIYPPQVALVGFGKTLEQPWAENGMLGIRPVVKATLAGDHRATDGRTGGGFLDVVNKYLQNPENLWE